MKQYWGSPGGGSRQDVARFYIGRHALVPFPRQDDIGVIAEVCLSFVLDNGAYTIFQKGGTLDADGYAEWVRHWYRHPGFDWALIPDIIDGSAEDNDAMLAAWPDDLRGAGVPIWHLHEPLPRLRALAEAWPIVALGSSGQYRSPGTAPWRARMREAMNVICDEFGRPICKLHGLRMLSPRVFPNWPLHSADSTNAPRNCNQLNRYGMYVPPTAWQRATVIAERNAHHNSAPVFQRTNDEFFECLRERRF